MLALQSLGTQRGKENVLPRQRFKKRIQQTIPTTRVGVIVFSEDEKSLLLVRHRKGNRQYWIIPGGRLEYGETFPECAVRELKEETGLDVLGGPCKTYMRCD